MYLKFDFSAVDNYENIMNPFVYDTFFDSFLQSCVLTGALIICKDFSWELLRIWHECRLIKEFIAKVISIAFVLFTTKPLISFRFNQNNKLTYKRTPNFVTLSKVSMCSKVLVLKLDFNTKQWKEYLLL